MRTVVIRLIEFMRCYDCSKIYEVVFIILWKIYILCKVTLIYPFLNNCWTICRYKNQEIKILSANMRVCIYITHKVNNPFCSVGHIF